MADLPAAPLPSTPSLRASSACWSTAPRSSPRRRLHPRPPRHLLRSGAHTDTVSLAPPAPDSARRPARSHATDPPSFWDHISVTGVRSGPRTRDLGVLGPRGGRAASRWSPRNGVFGVLGPRGSRGCRHGGPRNGCLAFWVHAVARVPSRWSQKRGVRRSGSTLANGCRHGGPRTSGVARTGSMRGARRRDPGASSGSWRPTPCPPGKEEHALALARGCGPARTRARRERWYDGLIDGTGIQTSIDDPVSPFRSTAPPGGTENPGGAAAGHHRRGAPRRHLVKVGHVT